MNAYGSQSEMGRPTSGGKGRYGNPALQIQKEFAKRSGDKKMEPSQNIYLIPIAVGETLIMLGLIAMNYCFRFDPSARDTSSLADYSYLNLQPSDVRPYRPFYNYSLSHDENQNSSNPLSSYIASFGISFGMPEYAFFVTAFVFPFLVILSVELGKKFLCWGKPRKAVDSLGIMFPTFARRILRFLYVYLMFGSMAGMLTAFIKLLIPLPRPHFMAVCMKDSGITPDIPFSVLDCPNPREDEVWEALRSFPSYHATIAVYGGAFVCLYLYYTMKFRGYYSVNVMLSLPVFVMAAIGTFHRWVTYHNTFMDIVWGGFIGLIMALYAVYGMLNHFKERASAILPLTAASTIIDHAPEPITHRMSPLQPQVHHNPAFVDDEPIGNHFVRHVAPMAKVPVNRPTQAFNSSFALDNDYRQHPDAQGRNYRQQPDPQGRMVDYNKPRQRFSMPPPPDHEPPMARPASAYPAPRAHQPPPPPRPRSRYEGASYF